MKDGPTTQFGTQPDRENAMALGRAAEASSSNRQRALSGGSDAHDGAGSLAMHEQDRASSATPSSSSALFSPWSSSSTSNSSTSQGYQANATSSSSIPSSLATSSSSTWMAKGLRIDTDPHQLPTSSSPSSAMSSVKTFIFPSFSSSSPASSKPPSITRRPSYQVDFEEDDPFASRPAPMHHHHQRQTSASSQPTQPLHLARQPHLPLVTNAPMGSLLSSSSPSSIHSSPEQMTMHLGLPLLPRPPRSSSRPRPANPSVTRITRERSSSNASSNSSSHSSFYFPSPTAGPIESFASSTGPNPKRSSNSHRPPLAGPPPTRPPPPIPTASYRSHHSHTLSVESAASELDGVWEGFLSEVVGKIALQPAPTSSRSSWQDKPLPSPPTNDEASSDFSVSLRPSESAVSGLAYLDEDEDEDDEAADEPFSLDDSFAASEYCIPSSSSHQTPSMSNSSSIQSIFEISAFNFPVPPSHLPRPTRHASNLSTSSSISSVSNGSSVPVTPSFLPPPTQAGASKAGEADLWGAGNGSGGYQETDEDEGDRTIIAWGRAGERRRPSEQSVEGEVVWGEAL